LADHPNNHYGCWPQSRKLTVQLRRDGWQLQIVKRKQRAFKVAGLTWIVERSFAWLGFNRRLSKDYEHGVQSSETMDRRRCDPADAQPHFVINFQHTL
jgi:transposase